MGTLWGGRFSKKTHKLVEEFTNSMAYDQRLAKYDCLGSLVHIDVLKDARLLSASEHKKMQNGLKRILVSIEKGKFKANPQFEDIHSYVQHLLEKDKQVGRVALKLHTCRSRNDQVAFDTKLYCLDHILEIERLLIALVNGLTELAEKNSRVFMPGFTHLQHAIPVAVSDQLTAYCEMLRRDETRLLNLFDNIRLVMGAGAVAGTMIAANSYQRKVAEGFPKSTEPPSCPMDTVSDRDFVLDFLYAMAMVGQHLSRFAEDMILWASKEFDFIDIDESFCTGSSLMPHKKNPDVLELVRGYAGRLYGHLTSVFVLMKGLPLSYNRDMQLDKEPLFASVDIVEKTLAVLSELVKNVKFKESALNKQLADECLYATDLADYLVRNGVAFKDAHKIVGALIKFKLAHGQELRDMTAAQLKKFHPLLSPKIVVEVVNPKRSVNEKRSIRRQK